MKRVLSFILSVVLVVMIFAGCDQEVYYAKPESLTMSDQKKVELLEQAYVFTLPLMLMDASERQMTNTQVASFERAPINQFAHAESLNISGTGDAFTSDSDTVNSQMFMDLGQDAVIIELPQTDRYCTVEIKDAYSNCIKAYDCSKITEETKKYIFVYDKFEGEIPEDMTIVQCDTPLNRVTVRIVCDGSEDMENVYNIQAKIKSYTYTQYQNQTVDTRPEGSVNSDNDIIPAQYVAQLSLEEYFKLANQLMEYNQPGGNDNQMLRKIEKINVGPGLEFDAAVFGGNGEEVWQNLVSNIKEITAKASEDFLETNGIWSYMGGQIGKFGTEYYYRAYVALTDFDASRVAVAMYSKATTDSSGEVLNGGNNYILHFDAAQIPAVTSTGFWTLTAYDSSDNHIAENEENIYRLSSRDALKYNDDGSLDVLLSATKPEDENANWLPVAAGDFYLGLRIYFPDDSVKNNEWTAPKVSRK